MPRVLAPAAAPPTGTDSLPSSAAGAVDAAWALAVALVPLALFARTLAYPALEVSDGVLGSSTSAFRALAADGLGGVSLWLGETLGGNLASRCVALILHAGSTALCFALSRRLGLARPASALVALLFAVHPLRVEAVAWLSQRGILLGGFLFLLGAWAALGSSRARAVAAGLALLLAFLTEPRLLGGLAWLAVIERWVLRRARTGARQALDVGLVAAAVWAFLAPSGPWIPTAEGLTRFAYAPLALVEEAGLCFLPRALGVHHPHPVLAGHPVAPWILAAGWLGVGLFLAAALRLERRLPLVGLGGLAFVLFALPFALWPRGPGLFHESSTYLALLGLELALVAGVRPRSRPGTALGALLVLALAWRGQARLDAWRAEPALQAAALALRPEPRALDALGRWHGLHGRLGEAQRCFERALALRPDDPLTRLALGELELRRALVPGQEAHLRAAREHLSAASSSPWAGARAHACLGEVFQRLNDPSSARPHLERATELDPADPTAHVRLGMVLRDLHELDGARTAFEHALRLDPRAAEAWCGLGLVRSQEGDPGAARACLERARELEPDHPETNAVLGQLAEDRGEREEAATFYRRALSVSPDNVEALFGLGAWLEERAPEEALRYVDRCVALRPPPRPHVRASLESARLHLARGETELARRLLAAVLDFNPAQPEALELRAALDASGR